MTQPFDGAALSDPVAALPRPDHVVIVMEENRGYTSVIGSPDAPYINSLAILGATVTNTYANTHPSMPNYLDLFAGSTLGFPDNACPVSFTNVPNLASELIAAGFTFCSFSEDLPGPGSDDCYSASFKYTRLINVVPDFDNVPAACNLPFTSFPTDFSTLPTVAFVVPNLDNNMDDGTIREADTWLQQHIDAYAHWAITHNSLLILHWDEDEDSGSNNRIPLIFFGPMVNRGVWTPAANGLIKTDISSLWDASATSTTIIAAGDAAVRVTVDTATYGRAIGLDNCSKPPSQSNIDYSLQFQSDGTLTVAENGIVQAQSGSYALGDDLSIAIESGVVNYYRNSTRIYSSGSTPVYPLCVQGYIRDTNGTLACAILNSGSGWQLINWMGTAGVSPFNNHFNVLRTLEDMYALPYAGLSGSVSPIAGIWT